MVIAHDSLLGFLNLFRRKDPRRVLTAGDRPPYPVIISDPDFLDVLDNLNAADFGVFALFSLFGVPLGRMAVRNVHIPTEQLRRLLFRSTVGFGIWFGMCMSCYNSIARLTGLTENGLRWRYNLNAIRKYDYTTEYEKGTLWQYLRAR